MEIGLVLIKLADVVARFSLIERDQIFPSKFNKLGQSARHDLCGAADQPFDFLLISGLLSPFKPLHWLPAASVNLTEGEKQAIKLGDHTQSSKKSLGRGGGGGENSCCKKCQAKVNRQAESYRIHIRHGNRLFARRARPGRAGLHPKSFNIRFDDNALNHAVADRRVTHQASVALREQERIRAALGLAIYDSMGDQLVRICAHHNLADTMAGRLGRADSYRGSVRKRWLHACAVNE